MTATASSIIVQTTTVAIWLAADHTICLALVNDGITVRMPGMTADQAEAAAALLTRNATEARNKARAVADTARDEYSAALEAKAQTAVMRPD